MPATLLPTVPLGIVDSMLSATVGTWTSVQRATFEYWSGALQRRSTPLDVGTDVMRWLGTMTERERPPWAHEHRIAHEWPIARLRDYSAADADPSMVATVLLPPQAGHDSSIVDYAADQSQIVTARESGCARVFALEWVGATGETRDTSIEDYMALLREVTGLLGGRVNLVGDCQGGWLATIFTALHPELVNSLAIAGAPIDFHAGEPLIHDWVRLLTPGEDLSFYRSVVDANDGVLPGRFLLNGFMAMQPDQELDRQLQLLAHLHDPAHVERYRRFENWFQWTQALPGEFYLWVVEHLFAGNELVRGELVVEGRTVDLAAIDCPLFLMAGETDHITPAPQVWALADYVSTPVDRIGRQASTGGHLGLFMSHEALRTHWPVIFAEMAALSQASVPEPVVLTDEPRRTGAAAGARPAARSTAASTGTKRQGAAPKRAAGKASAAKATPAAPRTTKATPAAPKAGAAALKAGKATPAVPKATAPQATPAVPKPTAPKAARPGPTAPSASSGPAPTDPAPAGPRKPAPDEG